VAEAGTTAKRFLRVTLQMLLLQMKHNFTRVIFYPVTCLLSRNSCN